ncbi:sugar ABC transporter substrate-binding protein [Leucobacter tenebrionis]|uniref:sugar ABC transporter substrate-binding protein n=1 Tax=Leucobacter tenebrionis TaxID=2873270 RepID=UPI001CA67630|nr:sugar ABC transporter substrate-binding protein [Leucobacter tenebrionis]QZY50773.1 sugar ABC transporter substrate-binding protein [Leucobacter tenebrionis]
MLKSRRGRWAKFGLAGIVATAALLLTACSGPAGVQGENKSDGDGGGAGPEKTMKVALITHSTPGDTFWDILRKGADAAADKDGIEVLYSSDPDGARQAQLVEQAVDQKVDGIVVTLAKPEAMSGAVKKATDAGIPVFSINAGEGSYKELGVLAHFGQDERVAGQAAGEKFNELGAKKVLCVIQEQGHVGLEDRCGGVKDTLNGELEIIYVTAADPTNIASTITAKLQTDSTVDYVLTLGAPQAPIARDSIAESGSSAKLATFDMNPDVAEGLANGDLQFAVDQQPYLQGYSAVDGVWLHKTNANVLGGGQPVLTGPAIITPDQADTLSEFVNNGTR